MQTTTDLQVLSKGRLHASGVILKALTKGSADPRRGPIGPDLTSFLQQADAEEGEMFPLTIDELLDDDNGIPIPGMVLISIGGVAIEVRVDDLLRGLQPFKSEYYPSR